MEAGTDGDSNPTRDALKAGVACRDVGTVVGQAQPPRTGSDSDRCATVRTSIPELSVVVSAANVLFAAAPDAPTRRGKAVAARVGPGAVEGIPDEATTAYSRDRHGPGTGRRRSRGAGDGEVGAEVGPGSRDRAGPQERRAAAAATSATSRAALLPIPPSTAGPPSTGQAPGATTSTAPTSSSSS